jgi:hypothetical protein
MNKTHFEMNWRQEYYVGKGKNNVDVRWMKMDG